MALMPPTKVYTVTPTGSKNVAAMICIPVLYSQQCSSIWWPTYMAEITAAAPKSMLAQANMLFIKHRVIKTACAMRPEHVNIKSISIAFMQPTISDPDHFERCVCIRNLPLARYSDQGEKDNHGTAACGEPEWASHAIIIPYKRCS